MMNNEHEPNSAPVWPRRLFLAFLPLAALFVLAFVLVRPATAAPVTQLHDYTYSYTTQNPCNYENVDVNAVFHVVSKFTMGANGTFHLDSHQMMHLTGVGDQGNTYVGSSVLDTVFNGKIGVEVTSEADALMISQGSAPNFDAHVIIHQTVNPDGTTTALVTHSTSTCRG